jgi:hypothetical protein
VSVPEPAAVLWLLLERHWCYTCGRCFGLVRQEETAPADLRCPACAGPVHPAAEEE